MKKIAFVSRRKIVAEGLKAVFAAHEELDFCLLPLIPPQTAETDALVYLPDILILDVTGEMQGEVLFSLCRTLKKNQKECRIILLLGEAETEYHTLSVQARQQKLADDFVFYDSSMEYLLAKLRAL